MIISVSVVRYASGRDDYTRRIPHVRACTSHQRPRKYFYTYATIMDNTNKLIKNKYASSSTILILKNNLRNFFSVFCNK